ncbi:DUF29 domain-containing protein [Pseudanabaena sp. CCNP1317]|jgi:hypothetical protein|nr:MULTISPECIES: DUF29 domain-containing protein [Pseudanabaena]MEA5488471.1 DUF29 domain-containing protein [Pseudanabaena sp. CCNP1317]WGS74273.1 DUF29 domain-containing protein [Pseudanabaena galeata CCNP1313]
MSYSEQKTFGNLLELSCFNIALLYMSKLYDQDFYGWVQWQEQALARHEVSALDWQNLLEEVQALGRQEYRELVSHLGVLLGHLLKWEYQPDRRSRSWFLTIREQRRAINRHFHRNPSLKSRIVEALADGFESGIDLALRETNLPLRAFPESCPYKFEDIVTENFICDTSQDWEQ